MKMHVLIIEDNVYVKNLLEHFLKLNYTVTVKNDGQEALDWLEDGNTTDLIISDIMMPNIDGYQLLNNIKSSAYLNEIPVIMLSSKEKSEERIKCFELGASDYILKPFNPEELEIRISRLIAS